jgi:hypothetical protein
MPKMSNGRDFIQWLEPDMSIKILTHLDDPSDLVRASSVSSAWHRFGKLIGLNNQIQLGLMVCC